MTTRRRLLALAFALTLPSLSACDEGEEGGSDGADENGDDGNDNGDGDGEITYDPDTDRYFDALIDGERVVFVDTKAGYANGGGWSGGTTDTGYQQQLNGAFYDAGFLTGEVENAGTVAIAKHFPHEPFGEDYEGMIAAGSYPLGMGSDGSDPGLDGAIIQYVDDEGVVWESDGGPLEGSFELESVSFSADPFGAALIEASFEVTLYDGMGASMTLTEGRLRSRMGYPGPLP